MYIFDSQNTFFFIRRKTFSNLGSKKFWFLYTFILIKDGMWKHRNSKVHVTILLMKENHDSIFLIGKSPWLSKANFLNLLISLYPQTSKYISVNLLYYCCRTYPFFHHQTTQQMMTKMYYLSFTWPQACIIHLKPKIRLHSLVK